MAIEEEKVLLEEESDSGLLQLNNLESKRKVETLLLSAVAIDRKYQSSAEAREANNDDEGRCHSIRLERIWAGFVTWTTQVQE